MSVALAWITLIQLTGINQLICISPFKSDALNTQMQGSLTIGYIIKILTSRKVTFN